MCPILKNLAVRKNTLVKDLMYYKMGLFHKYSYQFQLIYEYPFYNKNYTFKLQSNFQEWDTYLGCIIRFRSRSPSNARI